MDAAVLREFDWFRMDVAGLREYGCLRMNVAVLRQFGCLIDVDLQILREVVKICLDKSNLVTSPFPRVSQGDAPFKIQRESDGKRVWTSDFYLVIYFVHTQPFIQMRQGIANENAAGIRRIC